MHSIDEGPRDPYLYIKFMAVATYLSAVNFMNRPISYSATLDGCRLEAKNETL